MESNICVLCPVKNRILSGQDIGKDFLIDGWTREDWLADLVSCSSSQFQRWQHCYMKVFEAFLLFRERKISLIRHRHVLRAEAALQLRPYNDICDEIDSLRTSMMTKCYSEILKEEDLNELFKARSAFLDYRGEDMEMIETLSNQYSVTERTFFQTMEDRIANQELDAILVYEGADGAEESKR